MNLFVARQPIFDLRNEVVGYELLYRSDPHRQAAGADTCGAQMSADVGQVLLDAGVAALTQGRRSFVNFTEEMLRSSAWTLFRPSEIVVEVLETIAPDPDILAICKEAVRQGYVLALDDFVCGGEQDALLDLASIVKVDVLNQDPDELERVCEALHVHPHLQLLAERVETESVRVLCAGLGFRLFQGYFFARPETVVQRSAAVECSVLLELLNLVKDERVSDPELEAVFRRDPSLSYKLLRVVNSASLGGRGVDSIQQAIRFVGRAAIHRWLALLMASSLSRGGGLSQERVETTVLRGRFAELLARTSGSGASAGAMFLTGLFSLMDVLLECPMPDLLRRVRLDPSVQQALLTREGSLGAWLQLVEQYERGRWEEAAASARQLGIPVEQLSTLYHEAALWTHTQLAQASDCPGSVAVPKGT